MQIFRNASDVRLAVQLLDHDGNELSVTAVSYRITDRNGEEVVALTPLADFQPQASEAVILIPAAKNVLPAGLARDLRAVELQCQTEGNTVIVHESYRIELAETLIPGANSFQSLAQAEFNAVEIPNIDAWTAAAPEAKTAALIDARLSICQLNFRVLNGRNAWGQDSLNYIPEGVTPTKYVGIQWQGDLSFLTPEQYLKLPVDMRSALNRAQIAQANAILGGEPLEDRRNAGLLLDTVGEAKQMFRDEKPLQLPVCRRALSYLSRYITFSKGLARA